MFCFFWPNEALWIFFHFLNVMSEENCGNTVSGTTTIMEGIAGLGLQKLLMKWLNEYLWHDARYGLQCHHSWFSPGVRCWKLKRIDHVMGEKLLDKTTQSHCFLGRGVSQWKCSGLYQNCHKGVAYSLPRHRFFLESC